MAKLRTTPHLQNGVVCEKIFTFIVYPDSESYNCHEILSKIKKYPEYVYILHTKEDSKPHYHCLIRFPKVKSINALAKELGIDVHIIKWRNSFNGSLQYLTHENHKCDKDVQAGKKFIYDRTELISNLDDDYIQLCYTPSSEDKEDIEISKVLMILDYIESGSANNTRDIVRYACSVGCWSVLRRGGSWFQDSFKEVQNEKVSKQFKEKFDEHFKRYKLQKNTQLPIDFDSADDVEF